MSRGLFQRLEERVRGSAGDLMRLVDDVELRLEEGWRKPHPFPQLANVVDAAVAGGVDLDDVGRRAIVDRHAGRAIVAGTRIRIRIETVDRFREQASGGRFAGAPRTGEKVGMGYPIEPDRILQGTNDCSCPTRSTASKVCGRYLR